jgi:hypothetical protein
MTVEFTIYYILEDLYNDTHFCHQEVIRNLPESRALIFLS